MGEALLQPLKRIMTVSKSVQCRSRASAPENFPVEGQAHVKLMSLASKLAVKKGKMGPEYRLDLNVGDSSMQTTMSVQNELIESHIGKCRADRHIKARPWLISVAP